MTSQTPPSLLFEGKSQLEKWFAKNHDQSPGIWIRFAKKASRLKTVTYLEAVDCALRYGWIDSQVRKNDEDTYIQRFTPRGPRSVWSEVNRRKALALMRAGKMKPSGLRAVEQARKNGRWATAYSQGKEKVPPDLAEALGRDPAARAFFESLDSRNRFAILFRLKTALKPETRARRLSKFLEMLKKRQKIHPS